MPALSTSTRVALPAGSATALGEVVVVVSGDLDLVVAPALHDALTKAMAGCPAVVVVDMAGVTFLDASGLTTLVVASTRLRGRGARLALRAAPPRVRWLLELTRLSAALGLESPVASPAAGRIPRQGLPDSLPA